MAAGRKVDSYVHLRLILGIITETDRCAEAEPLRCARPVPSVETSARKALQLA